MTTTKQVWVRRAGWLVALGALLALMLVMLRGSSSGVVATVARIEGDVSRDVRGHEGAFRPAREGDEMSFGDAIRTGENAHARVVLEDGSALDLTPNTVVRFLANAPEAARFRVDTGLAMFQAGESGLSFATASGYVRVAAKSSVRITQDSDRTRLEVSFGRASFIDASQASEALLPGDELVVLRGQPGRVVKRGSNPVKPGDAMVPAGHANESPLLASNDLIDVDLMLEGRAPDAKRVAPSDASGAPARSDVTLRAGEYATVHYASTATVVRLRVEDACDGSTASVEISPTKKGRFRHVGAGATSVVFSLKPGITHYRVRCSENPRARVAKQGSVRVVRDAALRRVPLKPPTNTVDLDGRRYTVLYQNRLPTVVARWSSAKVAPRARLVVQSGSRLRTYDVSGNTFKLLSGQLEDGTHQLFFESIDGRQRSPATTLKIAFDNAAPTASIDQRGAIVPDAEGHAHISGVVPSGSRVSLDGQALVVDAGGRFTASALLSAEDEAVALRVEHPHAGVHYYVRRVAGGEGAR